MNLVNIELNPSESLGAWQQLVLSVVVVLWTGSLAA